MKASLKKPALLNAPLLRTFFYSVLFMAFVAAMLYILINSPA